MKLCKENTGLRPEGKNCSLEGTFAGGRTSAWSLVSFKKLKLIHPYKITYKQEHRHLKEKKKKVPGGSRVCFSLTP